MQDLIQIQTQTIYAVQLAAQFIQKEMVKLIERISKQNH